MDNGLIDYLSQFLTDERREIFSKVLGERTEYLTVVLEDIYQSQNASAVLRSCDCFGIQNVHIIESKNKFDINPDVALGSTKWLNLHKYNTGENRTVECIQSLKKQGYRIVATTPHTDDTNLEEFDLSKGKAAFIFGTELTGVSDDVMEHADEFLKIPMYGFTESFNISVSCALLLHHLTWKLRSSDLDFRLSEQSRHDINLKWLRDSLKTHEKIEERYRSGK